MNNLEKLQEAIYNALPRLKYDVVGQRYERHGEIYTCLFIDDRAKGEPFFYLYNTKITTWYLQEIQTRFDVLGQEIQLNDVLEWLMLISEYNDKYSITIGGDLLVLNFSTLEFELINCHLNPRWDLSKPLLKDQRQELIDYLVEMI